MRCVRRNARRRMRNARGQLGDLNELLGSGDVGRVARGRQSSQGGARPDAEGRRSAWSENGRRRPPHTHTAIQLARQREAGAEHRPRGVPCPISCPRPLYHSNARPPKEVRVHGKHGPSGVTSWLTAAVWRSSPRLTAAVPMENLYCSCMLTRRLPFASTRRTCCLCRCILPVSAAGGRRDAGERQGAESSKGGAAGRQ